MLRMKATFGDLQHHSSEVLKALERNETVTVLHRGKVRETIYPAPPAKHVKACEHPFFGSAKNSKSVQEVTDELRSARHDF